MAYQEVANDLQNLKRPARVVAASSIHVKATATTAVKQAERADDAGSEYCIARCDTKRASPPSPRKKRAGRKMIN